MQKWWREIEGGPAGPSEQFLQCWASSVLFFFFCITRQELCSPLSSSKTFSLKFNWLDLGQPLSRMFPSWGMPIWMSLFMGRITHQETLKKKKKSSRIWEISFLCSSWNSLWQGELTHLHRSQEGNVNPIRKIIYHQKIIIIGVEKESFWGKFIE